MDNMNHIGEKRPGKCMRNIAPRILVRIDDGLQKQLCPVNTVIVEWQRKRMVDEESLEQHSAVRAVHGTGFYPVCLWIGEEEPLDIFRKNCISGSLKGCTCKPNILVLFAMFCCFPLLIIICFPLLLFCFLFFVLFILSLRLEDLFRLIWHITIAY